MKKIFKFLGLGFLALSLVVGVGAHSVFATDVAIAGTAVAGVSAPLTTVSESYPLAQTVTATSEYTGTVTWSPALVETDTPVDYTVADATVYTATITLTPKTGYTLTGVIANQFTVSGATTTNAADSGVITAVFPITHAPYLTATIHNEAANTITYIWDEPIQLKSEVDPYPTSAVTAGKLDVYTVDNNGVWDPHSPTEGITISTVTFDDTGTIMTVTYTGTLGNANYVVDATDYGIVDLTGNLYQGAEGVSPIFTVGADTTDPTLTAVAHSETANTITLTFDEAVQFVDKTTQQVLGPAELPAILNIFVATANGEGGWDYNVGSDDGVTPSTVSQDVTITAASFNADNTILTITYSGSLVKSTVMNYIVDYWVFGTPYGEGQDLQDQASNSVVLGDVLPEFEVAARHVSTGSGGGNYHPPVTHPENEGGCSSGNKYNTSTGALCVNNGVPQGCSGGNLFNTSTGQACVNNSGNNGNNNSNQCSPTHSGPYNFGTTTLRNGSTGEAVKELQRFLNAELCLSLVVDGMLGPKTITVIKKWQAAHNLVADGLVGPLTKVKMNAEAN